MSTRYGGEFASTVQPCRQLRLRLMMGLLAGLDDGIYYLVAGRNPPPRSDMGIPWGIHRSSSEYGSVDSFKERGIRLAALSKAKRLAILFGDVLWEFEPAGAKRIGESAALARSIDALRCPDLTRGEASHLQIGYEVYVPRARVTSVMLETPAGRGVAPLADLIRALDSVLVDLESVTAASEYGIGEGGPNWNPSSDAVPSALKARAQDVYKVALLAEYHHMAVTFSLA